MDEKGLSENFRLRVWTNKKPRKGEYVHRLATVYGTRSFFAFCGLRIVNLRQRYTMSAIVSLSRPGLCAGRLPFQLLIFKLLRFGEHAAAASLQSLPLAYQRRVRWTLYGTSMTVEVA